MAATVSLITIPDEYTTVNAEGYDHLWFIMNSASASLPNFTYVVDVNMKDQFNGNQQDYLGRFNFPPRPIDNDGLFSPAKILRSVIDDSPVDFDVTIQGIQSVSASIVRYNIGYGFQYDPGITFSTIGVPFFGFLAINTQLSMVNGDEVILQFDNQKVNPQYNGPASVTPFGPNTYITNNIFNTAATASQSGLITNLLTIQGTSSQLWSWNGTKQYTEQGINFGSVNQYVLNSGAGNFLTDYVPGSVNNFGVNAPGIHNWKPVLPHQYETMGFIINPNLSSVSTLFFNFYGFDGLVIPSKTFTIGITPSYGFRKYELGMGPQNITDAYGFTFSSDIYYYRVGIGATGAPNQFIARTIDQNCQYCYYNVYQMTWLNRRGSYDYYNFYKDSKRTININRTEWKRELPVPYELGDRGRSVLSQDIDINYTIQTNWISEYDYAFLEELASSPEVYVVQQGTQSTSNRIPVIITDTSYTTKTQIRDILFNLEVSFKYAYSLNIQNQ